MPFSSSTSKTHGQIVRGSARFTFLTENCLRLEFAPLCGFVDAPTLFACNRQSRVGKLTVREKRKLLTVETDLLRLEYRDDGKAFHEGNLKVTYRDANRTVVWKPGMKNQQNLGGPVATLDGVRKAFDLPDGLLARDGWHVIDDSGKPIFQDGWIAQRPGDITEAERAPGKALAPHPDRDWYLFAYGDNYKSALASLAAVSGRAAMPRKHVLGSWYCRWFPYTEKQFREIVREYDEHGFPIDVLVMDMDWHAQNARTGFGHANNLGWTGYTWNKKLIPNPQKLLDDLKRNSIYVTLNDHPADGIREHEACHATFTKLHGKGTPANLPFNAGSQRYMESFFAAAHAGLEKQGVDFWWVDWQQDYIYPRVLGVPGLPHLPWLNHLYYKHSQEGGRRGQGFSRWGGWGDHRHPIQFSGDAHACWDMLEFEVPFTVASGNAGCFFWAHDAGGFYGERNPETYTRWVQFCALSASLRVHSVGDNLDRRPWLWGKRFEDAMRGAFRLRAELFPYIYGSVRQCYDQTIPLLRGMYLEYPDHEEAYQHRGQYLFGDHFLVAPITKAGQGARRVAEQTIWFPKGDWYHFLTGEKIEGGQTHTLPFGIDEIPLFVKGGVPIPLQPYSRRMASAPLDTLRVRCYPGGAGESSLYEDDGQSEAYKGKDHARTRLQFEQSAESITVQIGKTDGTFKGQRSKRAYQIELPGQSRPKSVAVNGKVAEFAYEKKSRMIVVKIPATSIRTAVQVVVRMA